MTTANLIELSILLKLKDDINKCEIIHKNGIRYFKSKDTYYNADEIEKRLQDLIEEFLNNYAVKTP